MSAWAAKALALPWESTRLMRRGNGAKRLPARRLREW